MVGVIVALLVSAGLCRTAIRVGPALGYIDRPDDPSLKVHTQPAVPLGGVGLFVGVHLGLGAAGRFDAWLFAASLLLLTLGLADDRMGLSPLSRLGAELIAGTLLAVGVAGSLGWSVAVLVGLLVVVAVNAVNLFDGLDGLVGSSALVTALAVSALAGVRGLDPVPGLILAAALVGFLMVNWHPARVFLGDNGAYSLAAFLVAGIAGASTGASTLLDLLVGIGLLGVFLVDLASTVLRRYLAHQPLFLGDRNHLYDRLHAQGRSVPSVALLTATVQVVLAGIVVGLAATVPAGWAVGLVVVLGVVSVAALAVGPWLEPSAPQSG